MRRVIALLIVLASVVASRATPAQTPAQATVQAPDGISRLVSALEHALAAGHVEEFRALEAGSLPPDDGAAFEKTSFAPHQSSAVVRERDRLITKDGTRILTEMLIEREGRGLLATWQIDVKPSSTAPDRFEITGLQQVAGVDGLLRLALDVDHEFKVTNFTFTATDFTLSMSSGTAFLAKTEEGTTGLVLRGQGEAQFRPADDTERGQLMLFAKKPELVMPLDTAFIRLSPDEYDQRVSAGSLTPISVVADHAARAAAVFEERGQRAYHLSLGDLSTARWSVLPPAGDVLVEMLTSKWGWLSYSRVSNDPEDVSLFDRQAHKNFSVYASVERRRSRGRFYSDDDGARFTVEHIDVDAHLDPDKQTASGVATLRVRVMRDGVNTLQLRLAESLAVQSVTSEQLGRLLSLRNVVQNGLIISLPAALARGSELTVTIAYSGRLVPQGLDREALEIEQDQTASDLLPVQEPIFAYSNRTYWYPQVATNDFATAKLTLHVPSRYEALATGSMITPVPPATGIERTVQFIADRPVRSLACVISRLSPVSKASASVPSLAFPTAPEPGGAVVAQLASPSVKVEVLAQPREAGAAKPFAARAAGILTYYASIVGEAPYPNYVVAAVDGLVPGGHSPAYMTILNQSISPLISSWRDDPVAFDDVAWFFLAHEAAHQWWGQAIGGKNYHEQWLSEGLAQYFALRYVEHDRGADAARDVLSRMRDTARAQAGAGPIYLGYRLGHIDNNTRAYRSILYNKSAVVLHMLRQLIGDAAFDAGIRRYYHDQRFGKAGTQDLQFAFEIESQKQLGRFFDQWIMGADIPRLKVTTKIETSGPAGDAIAVHVEQTGPVFDVPITLIVTYESGQSESVAVGISEASEDVRVPATPGRGKIRRVRVDEAMTLADFAKG